MRLVFQPSHNAGHQNGYDILLSTTVAEAILIPLKGLIVVEMSTAACSQGVSHAWIGPKVNAGLSANKPLEKKDIMYFIDSLKKNTQPLDPQYSNLYDDTQESETPVPDGPPGRLLLS